jgi:hypothetical protein
MCCSSLTARVFFFVGSAVLNGQSEHSMIVLQLDQDQVFKALLWQRQSI